MGRKTGVTSSSSSAHFPRAVSGPTSPNQWLRARVFRSSPGLAPRCPRFRGPTAAACQWPPQIGPNRGHLARGLGGPVC